MDKFENYLIGEWLPGLYKYKKLCRQCSMVFYGRKNQDYCNDKCRTKYNNEKRTRINSELDRQVYELKTNAAVLKKFYHLSVGCKMYDYYVLRNHGFKIRGPFTNVVLDVDNGDIWRQAGEYAFREGPRPNQIIITKIEKKGDK